MYLLNSARCVVFHQNYIHMVKTLLLRQMIFFKKSQLIKQRSEQIPTYLSVLRPLKPLRNALGHNTIVIFNNVRLKNHSTCLFWSRILPRIFFRVSCSPSNTCEGTWSFPIFKLTFSVLDFSAKTVYIPHRPPCWNIHGIKSSHRSA